VVRHFLSVVFGAAFTAAVSWCLGRFLFARLRIRLEKTEHELLAGVTGATLLSLIVFLLCVIQIATVPVFWATGIVAAYLGWVARRPGPGNGSAATNALSPVWKWLCVLPFIFYALLYLSNSLAPENSPDGSSYHLGLVYRYFRQHGFERLTTNMYGNLSQGMEMLYLFAFAFGRNAASATVHCCCLFALPITLLSYGRRTGHLYAGACAGMMVYLSPLAGIDGVSAYNDVALALAAFAAYYLLEIWREPGDGEKQNTLLVPVGLVAGFCFAIKYTGFVVAVYAIAIVVWELVIRERLRGRMVKRNAFYPIATLAAMIALMTAPWLLKNALWLGNPVSPFMNRLFPNHFTHITFEDEYRKYLATYDLKSFKPLFWILTVGGQLGGQLGPVFLLTPLALLTLRTSSGRRLLFASLLIALPYPQNIGARFLIPILPFVAMGIALALEFSRAAQAVVVLAASLLGWPRIIDKYRAPAGGWQIVTMPWQAALGIIPQDKWLTQHASGWVTARMLDQFVPQGKRVWSTTPVAEAYEKTEVLVNYYSAEGELIQDILTAPVMPDYQPLRLLRYTFPARTVERLRIVQEAQIPEVWSINEVKFFRGAGEILPQPQGKSNAEPFPWDIALAFDRNPATRWRAWEPSRPGMYVEMDFGAPVELDRVELECSTDQGDNDVQLEAIDAKLEKLKLDPMPPERLKRLATQTVKARGIDYLLIVGDNWLAPDMFANPAVWGLKKVADRGNAWLFEIQ
jgi:hypothetical protein